MKKILLIMLLAIIGFGSKTMGQGTCQNAQQLNFNDSVQTINMQSNEYWFHFVADSLFFKINLLPSYLYTEANISMIKIYESNNGCSNLILKNQIDLLLGDSILKFQTIQGNTYLLQFIGTSTQSGNLSFYVTNKSVNAGPMICGPNSCQINSNSDFSTLTNDLIDALNTNSPTATQSSMLTDPLIFPYFGCCNWFYYTGSPQIFKEGTFPNYNYYLYMWAKSANGDLSFETAYNRLVGNTVTGNNNGIVAGQNYNIKLKYRERGAGISGFYIFFCNENSQGIIQNSITQVIDYPLSTAPNTTNFIPKDFNITSSGNYNCIMIRPYQINAGVGVTTYGGLDIDDFIISPTLQINKPIISGNPNNCNSITSYFVSNFQECVDYNWEITPQNAGSIISGQGTPQITVEWKDMTACENILKVTASSLNSDSKETIMNIYTCCNTNPLQLNNATIIHVTYYDKSININGDLHVFGNVVFDNCRINLSPYAKIIVEQGANLSLINATSLSNNECCNIMWDGIYINGNTSSLTATSLVVIHNSINGIVATNNANININNVEFNYNFSSLSLKNYSTQPSNVIIKNNRFFGEQLIEPYVGGNSRYGIKIENADNIIIGKSSGLEGNDFNKPLWIENP